MFDPNLTREKAQEDIGDINNGASLLEAETDRDVISLCKKTSELRNICFSSEENYRKNIDHFNQILEEFRGRLTRLEVYKFIYENFSIYADAGNLQNQYAKSVYMQTCTELTENISNAMVQSDEVRTSIHVTPQGVLIDLNQSKAEFPTEFLKGVKRNASNLYEMLEQEMPLAQAINQIRKAVQKTIGFVPAGLEEFNGLPYRGNGIGNMLVNSLIRTNFYSDASGEHTLSIHSSKQLLLASRAARGDKNAAKNLFRPSEIPIPTEILDDFFKGGFDMKKI